MSLQFIDMGKRENAHFKRKDTQSTIYMEDQGIKKHNKFEA